MAIYQVISVGTFCTSNKEDLRRKLALQTGEPLGGFYAARFVSAPDRAEAILGTSSMIQNELFELLNVQSNDYILEIESCVELDAEPDYVNSGFAFFGED